MSHVTPRSFVSFLATWLSFGILAATDAQAKVMYLDPTIHDLHQPEALASHVLVGRVEALDFDEYRRENHIERLYTITFTVFEVQKGEGLKPGETIRFTARHPHALLVGPLSGRNPWSLQRDEVSWIPQVGDTVRVCLGSANVYRAVAGNSITPHPISAEGAPVTLVTEERVMRTGDWVALAVAVGLVTFIGGVFVGRRWSRGRATAPVNAPA